VKRAPVNIVQRSFWENDYYWAGATLPCRADMSFAFDRSLARALCAHAAVEPGQQVLEVGCAPAKWLIFYAERFGARVAGIEYSAKGARLSRENLAAAGAEGVVYETDFFSADPRPYDLVVSIGFVEHFDDPAAALARHLDFVAPGGRLAVGVPNLIGCNGWLQRLAEPGYLALHNQAAMRPSLYRNFARDHDLQLAHLGYLGGFDPAIICLGRGPLLSPGRVIPGAVTLIERHYRRLSLADRLEHRWLSSYLLAVFHVP